MPTYIALTNRSVPDVLVFNMARRVKGRDYLRPVSVDAGELGMTMAGTWVAAVLLALHGRSVTEGAISGDLLVFSKVLTLAGGDDVAKAILCKPIRTIGRADVIRLFDKVEALISLVPSWAGPTRAANSSVFRRFMAEEVPKALFAEDVSSHRRYFQTVLRERHKPRATLSELPSVDSDIVDPIGAIPHERIEDLRETSLKRLMDDIEAVKDACTYDLEFWSKVRNTMRTYARKAIPRADYRHIVNFVNDRVVAQKNMLTIWDFPIETVIGALGRFERNKRISRNLLSLCFDRLLQAKITSKLEIAEEECGAVSIRQIAGLTICVNSREMVASFHILLIHTGWNADALLNMRINNLIPSENGYLIQGLKGKVDKRTQQVFVGPGDRGAWIAINLLIWNYHQLHGRGLIDADDERLWFCWSRPSKKVMTQLTNMERPKRMMLARHRIEWFSDEQIRNHMLLLISMRRRNGLLDAQMVADHSYIGTTAHYADQLITKLLSSSINLEFQRRLDSTLKISLWGEHSEFVKRLRFQKFDPNLAIPIGDGTLCVAPENPPNVDWLMDGICDAKRCHSGRGCANNRISVSASSVEELSRFVQYYKKNWRRLLADNDAAFREFHGPAMLFALAFMQFIQTGPYWEKLKRYVAIEEV
ncbi:hypothetical protein [Paraburkholderia sp. BL9I2N2]|uniref:hypothetical protein n=1 Tax=Paraburkholderia sp. BL9I2N2 TaxID=1938809 RepID=UPI00104689D9|nr:hypothetical protein [Paraburkholderia sp. BL9I2N2]TCK96994.1 hypothetical protein B0G74_3695 [Paraburkholderia sp. BL9I2N2]